jgi:guanine deaminase
VRRPVDLCAEPYANDHVEGESNRMTPEQLMARAIEMGRDGIHLKDARPFVALVVSQGEIIGEGRSQQKAVNDPTAHGEIVAIRDACKRLGTTDLSGCELYTTCEPCLLCVAAIFWAKISRMYYAQTQEGCERIGFSTKALVEEVTRPLSARKLPSRRILAAEADFLFEEWAASPHFQP